MDKRILEIEEAIVTWSRIWGYSMTEWGMNRAEAQIDKLQKQLASLKASTE